MPTTYVSRLSQWIEKRYNAKGGNVITDVDPSAIVQLPVLIGVEERYGQGWNRYIGSFAVVAVAGQFSRAQLLNPAGSNVIAVVESIFFNQSTASAYTIANGQANLANVQPAGTFLRRLDLRSGFTDSTCTLSSDTNATEFPGSANVIMRRGLLGEVVLTPDLQWTLLPRDSLWMVTDVVNTSLQVNIQWRERALEQSELT